MSKQYQVRNNKEGATAALSVQTSWGPKEFRIEGPQFEDCANILHVPKVGGETERENELRAMAAVAILNKPDDYPIVFDLLREAVKAIEQMVAAGGDLHVDTLRADWLDDSKSVLCDANWPIEPDPKNEPEFRVSAILKAWGFNVSYEYPGTVDIVLWHSDDKRSWVRWVFGTVNPYWGGDLCNSEGQNLMSVELPIRSDSLDFQGIAHCIACTILEHRDVATANAYKP